MNEKNTEDHYLSLKDILSESLLRDLVLFTFLFLLIITQTWDNILLLLFPLITFAFSLFFRIICSNKKRIEFQNSLVIYNPLGLERKNANRLFFSSLFQLILIFWLGAESLYNPHLVEGYYPYFTGIFIFSYTFGFFWIFIDLWKYSRLEILTKHLKDEITQYDDSQFSNDLRNVISFLKLKNFKIFSFAVFIIFIILNIINVIILLLLNYDSIGILLFLPGSQIMTLSFMFYGFLVISPTLTAILLILNYMATNNFSREKLDSIIEPLPRNMQIKIIENLKALNSKIKEQLKSE
ncbi:MAG: hypothetical protein JSV23_07770 [Promethearchaeota archaeon]|nr:MAG: hypothetical protein JSV23_07770 [Candidatus Lokiarchaeota archaeon]